MRTSLSAAEYRLLVEHSPVMVWRSGPDASCDYFNETWLAFTGRSFAEELGDGWTESVHPDDLKRCVAHYLDNFERRAPFEMEYRLRRHDNVYRWIFDRGVPCTDESGRFAGYVGSCVDVDERRRVEAIKDRHTEQQLSLAREFERWVLAIVSHDIRNPLNAIQVGAYRLAQLVGHTDGATKYLDMVGRSVERIEHIVGELLDWARSRSGSGIPLSLRPADMRTLCQQVIEELETVRRDHEITFDCEVDPAGDWDAHRVLQAISNLASNAVQHGSPGSPVQVRLTGDAERVAVEVHSQGTIPGELLPRLFDPFRSARLGSTRGDGLGLGLFITRAIAQAHGGGVEVDSSQAGTMFRLVLPRHPPVPPL